MATSIQTFAGNVGIGTNDPKAYALNVADGGTTRITTLSATTIQVGTVTNSFIPAGTIGMWGSTPTIPTGWVICDGNNGTPNLNGKFIVGAGNAYAVNDTGGNANSTVVLGNANMPAHSHSGTTSDNDADHYHYVGDPGHYHRQKSTDDGSHFDSTTGQSSNFYGQIGFNTFTTTASISYGNNDANHTHTLNVDITGSNSAIGIWPAYRDVIFIMKT